MIITFAGHRFLLNQDAIKEELLRALLENTSTSEDITFYCGGYGMFDSISACACREIKRYRPNAELVFVTPYIDEESQKNMKALTESGLYDSTVYPPLEAIPKRFAIIKRNIWMIKSADLVIAYVKKTHGGAYNTLSYAKRKKKKIINLADII